MPSAYIAPTTMPITQVHAVLTTRAMPGSAVLNPGFLTKQVGMSASSSLPRAYGNRVLTCTILSAAFLNPASHISFQASGTGLHASHWRRISFPIHQPYELTSQRIHINCLEIEAPILRQILP